MISNGRPTIPLPEQNSANLMATTLAMFECPNASIAFAIGNAITKKLKQLFNPFSIAFTKSFVFLIVLTVTPYARPAAMKKNIMNGII